MSNLDIVLPELVMPIANYVPFVRVGNTLYISGQLPMENGKMLSPGKLGNQVSIEQGNQAAKMAALNVLAQVKATVGSLSKVKRVVKITGFVNSTPEFTQHPQVVNGASDLFVEVFGDNGKHARSAVGVASLPLDAPVEIEAIFEIAS